MQRWQRGIWGVILAVLLHWGWVTMVAALPMSTIADWQTLSAQAQTDFEAGHFTQALDQLRTAYHRAQDQHDALATLIVGRNLALVQLQLRDWPAAETTLRALATPLTQIPPNLQTEQQGAIAELWGQWHFEQGQDETALTHWQTAVQHFQTLGDVESQTRNQLHVAQALRYLGHFHRANQTLTRLPVTLAQSPDSPLKVRALLQLGELQHLTGQNLAAIELTQRAFALATDLNTPVLQVQSLLLLGHLAQDCPDCDLETPLDYYTQAVRRAPDVQTRHLAQRQQLDWWLTQPDPSPALPLFQDLRRALSAQAPPDRDTLYQRLHLAQVAIQAPALQSPGRTAQDLAQLLPIAQDLRNLRAQAHIWYTFGQLYAQQQHWQDAHMATERSLQLAESLRAPALIYPAQGQLGRIFTAQGERHRAIAAYASAIAAVAAIRDDLVAMSTDVRFSFRERVEPLYRAYVDLLLQPGATDADLQAARRAIEGLQLVQLDNFFRDACSDAQDYPIDQLDPHTAVLYPIVLRDRLAVIAALPGQELVHYSVPVEQSVLTATAKAYRLAIASPRDRAFTRQRLRLSRQMYDWLLAPIAEQLNAVQTLVFVPDGVLRNLPLASLYDGEQYLVERFSLAIAPSLNLVNPRSLRDQKLRILLGGLTQARDEFIALPNVATEAAAIAAQLPTTTLLDAEFTTATFANKVSTLPVPIVHLATHGVFSSRSADTFILTWDDRLDVAALNALLQRVRGRDPQGNPVELLVLSACQTASGDDRAALGLAGVAVRAGARSTLASLWFVDDNATATLMENFYRELAQAEPAVTRAEALRRAQRHLIAHPRFHHPYYWSAFTLIGNWL